MLFYFSNEGLNFAIFLNLVLFSKKQQSLTNSPCFSLKWPKCPPFLFIFSPFSLQSPQSQNIGSNEEESRIDSEEQCHLVGGEIRVVGIWWGKEKSYASLFFLVLLSNWFVIPQLDAMGQSQGLTKIRACWWKDKGSRNSARKGKELCLPLLTSVVIKLICDTKGDWGKEKNKKR